jgi:hypothetical protein
VLRFVLAAAVLLLGLSPAAPRTALAQNEILLNDDRVDRNQWSPHAALGSTGAIVVAWMDGRNGGAGFTDYDTYIMTLRDPLGLGSTVNRRLNDDGPGSIQGTPHIASSPSGTFFCAWEDGRAGNRDIYGAALDSLGVAIGPNLRINDDIGASDQTAPRIAPVGLTGYVVAWTDGRVSQGEVFASYRNASGGPLGGNLKISVDPIFAGSYQGEPSVAVDGSGRTLVVWLDGREGGSVFGATFDVYAQWLDAGGAPIGGNFKINDTTGAQQCASPVVVADPTLGFVVAWIDSRSAPTDLSDVYAQRFDAAGAAIGPNVRVNDDPLGRQQRAVRGTAGPGTAVLIWEDLRGNLGLDSNAEAAFVPYGAGPPSANFRVNSDTGGRQGTPSALWDGRDAYLGVWEDGRRGSSDVFAISFFPDGTRRGSDTQLNDDAAPFDQRRPRLGRGPGYFLATWIDRRSLTNDLYGQWVTAAGARVGPNHLLWHDDDVERPLSARGAVAPSGAGLVVAHIARFSDAGDIRGFVYTTEGESPAAGIWVGDVLPSAQASPVVAARSGGFAVAWIDSRDGEPRVYGQRLAEDGTRLGGNHAVLAADPADPVTALDVEADPSGGWWLLYAEGAAADQRLWLIHLSDGLLADGEPLALAPEVSGGRSDPGIAVGADGRIEVVWLGPGASGLGQVYYRSYTASLEALTPLLALGEPSLAAPQAAPTLAIAGPYSVVAWEEESQGNWSIWMQRFQGGALPASGVVRVDEDLTGADQLDPAAGMDASGRAIVIWSDLRSASSGMDILGRVFQFTPTSAEEPPPDPEPVPDTPPAAPRALRVGPARPNPFSSATATPVETVASGRLLARVVNVRGEVVAVLHDGPTPAARFVLRWDGVGRDGRPAASGVYWLLVDSGGERRATRLVHLR